MSSGGGSSSTAERDEHIVGGFGRRMFVRGSQECDHPRSIQICRCVSTKRRVREDESFEQRNIPRRKIGTKPAASPPAIPDMLSSSSRGSCIMMAASHPGHAIRGKTISFSLPAVYTQHTPYAGALHSRPSGLCGKRPVRVGARRYCGSGRRRCCDAEQSY